MRTRANGPGRTRCIIEPSDPIVLTDIHGEVIAGPLFWDGDTTRAQVTFDSVGGFSGQCCGGVLRSDGVLAWQSGIICVVIPGSCVTLIFNDMMEPESFLTAADYEWLRGQTP